MEYSTQQLDYIKQKAAGLKNKKRLRANLNKLNLDGRNMNLNKH